MTKEQLVKAIEEWLRRQTNDESPVVMDDYEGPLGKELCVDGWVNIDRLAEHILASIEGSR